MATLQDAFAKLRDPYVRATRERLDRMRRVLERLAEHPDDRGELDALWRHFHALTGSGGSYGFPGISEIGRREETACVAALEARLPITPELLTNWTQALAQVAEALATTFEATATPSDPEPTQERRALIVTQEAPFAASLSRVLSREGWLIDTATTRTEAVASARIRPPTAVVAASRLPDGTGAELTRELKALKSEGQPFVLLFGVGADFLERVEGLRSGADTWIEASRGPEAIARSLRVRSARPDSARVLAVEDDPAQAAYVRTALEGAGFVVKTEADPRRLEVTIVEFRPDILLMDIDLPGADGRDLVRCLRLDSRHATLPIVFVTTHADAYTEALRIGGDDFLMKPVRDHELVSLLTTRVQRARVLRELLRRDPSTDLLNAAAFQEVLEEKLVHSPSSSLILFEVDALNSPDDLAMQSVAGSLRRSFSGNETLARIGERSLAVVQPDDSETALRHARQVVDDLATMPMRGTDGKRISVRTSAGIVSLSGLTPAAAMRLASEAVHDAQSIGGNQAILTASDRPIRRLGLVALGGGHGLSSLLRGLKLYLPPSRLHRDGLAFASITALVTVTDNGGSSGRLRDELGVPPPGDIRNCLVALSPDETLLAQLLQYRFHGGGSLGGHSFGNLLLTALSEVTGNFLQAVRLTGEILAIRGRIYPSTATNVQLTAELEGGAVVTGEEAIVEAIVHSGARIRRMSLTPPGQPLPEALKAIEDAQIVTLGPGSLYTSTIPNLLVDGLCEALQRSPAIKVFVANLMTQPGETVGMSFLDHVGAILDAAPGLALDVVVANDRILSEEAMRKHSSQGSEQLMPPTEPEIEMRGRKIRLITGDLIADDGTVRHDADKVARLLLEAVRSATPARAPSVSI